MGKCHSIVTTCSGAVLEVISAIGTIAVGDTLFV